jgi:hypothetical protein
MRSGREHVPVVGPYFTFAYILRGDQVDRIAGAQVDARRGRTQKRGHSPQYPPAYRDQRPDACVHMLQKGSHEFANLTGVEEALAQMPVKRAAHFA